MWQQHTQWVSMSVIQRELQLCSDRQSSTCVPSLQNIPILILPILCPFICVCVRIFERWPVFPGDIAATIIWFQSRIKCRVKLEGMGFIGTRAPESGWAQHGSQSTLKGSPPRPRPPGLYQGLKINRGHSFFFFFPLCIYPSGTGWVLGEKKINKFF
jgi:hypothetical protein